MRGVGEACAWGVREGVEYPEGGGARLRHSAVKGARSTHRVEAVHLWVRVRVRVVVGLGLRVGLMVGLEVGVGVRVGVRVRLRV